MCGDVLALFVPLEFYAVALVSWVRQFSSSPSGVFRTLQCCYTLNVQMVASERLQVVELRNQGHSDRQLQEMGFLEISLHSPAVASMKTLK
jgi:hypothetical protein